MDDNLLADAFDKFLSGRCTAKRVRQIEIDPSGEDARKLWNEVDESGFADVLTAESAGGSGLGLSEAALIAVACGRYALPLPLALTVPVRAALAAMGAVPRGPITIALAPTRVTEGPIGSTAVPYGLVADWVLLCTPTVDWLLPTVNAARQRSGGHGSVAADIQWLSFPDEAVALRHHDDASANWRVTAAAFVAAQMAGTMGRLLEMTIGYANDRVQFGKPIGKLQVIQQQISVMAEQTFAARTAALVGLSGAGTQVDSLRAAIAKARCGEAAVMVAAASHAVHGAIGVTEEFDLQMYTRRLQEWRGQYGGETYWHRHLGMKLLGDTVPPLEFVQNLAIPATAS